jgi:hypothetical protein
MKIGDEIKDKNHGIGVVTDITTEGFKVNFKSGRVILYPHLRNEKILAVALLYVVAIVSLMAIFHTYIF